MGHGPYAQHFRSKHTKMTAVMFVFLVLWEQSPKTAAPGPPFIDPGFPFIEPKFPFIEPGFPFIDSRFPFIDSRFPFIDFAPKVKKLHFCETVDKN